MEIKNILNYLISEADAIIEKKEAEAEKIKNINNDSYISLLSEAGGAGEIKILLLNTLIKYNNNNLKIK